MPELAAVGELSRRLDGMVELLGELVSIESPSSSPEGVAACAGRVAAAGHDLLGTRPETVVTGDVTHLRWRFGASTRVVLLGHADTVWPIGTLARWPFEADAARATGPGCFDMKAGLVQLLFAAATLDDLDGVTILVTGDEEVGSRTSRELIVSTVAGAAACLVLEPSAAGALKTARKGVSMYDIDIEGRAAHAGLEPELGANATVELAELVLAINRLGRPEAGTTVTPTTASAGTAINTVPAAARLHVDVRAFTEEEQHRVDKALHSLKPAVDGTSMRVDGGPNRPPFPTSASRALFERAAGLAADLGLPPLSSAEVGGGSDGNFTAGAGVPTLDGLGAVGDNAHAEGEYVDLASMPQRAALVAALVSDLLT